MRIKSFFSQFWNTLKKTFPEFVNDNAVKLSASLSYYTIFSMPPLILIVVALSGLIFGKEAIQGHIYGQISQLTGPSTALAVQDIISHVTLSRDTFFAAVVGGITLFIGATGTFAEIQDSINTIWQLKAKPKRGWLKWIINRLLSFSLIVSVSFLLMVSLFVSALMDLFSARLQNYFELLTVQVFFVLNLLLVFIVITLLFTVIFKTLPDGKVSLSDALKGSSFTAILFMLGKFAIGAYLGNSNVTTIYGAAGSVIIIILWVYYSSMILYFGAEFTKVYARTYGKSIIPNDYAVRIEKKEIERTPLKSAV
jgi:membrane protein